MTRNLKRTLTLFLSLTLLLGLIPLATLQASAATPPTLIRTAAQLNAIRTGLSGSYIFEERHNQ